MTPFEGSVVVIRHHSAFERVLKPFLWVDIPFQVMSPSSVSLYGLRRLMMP